MTEKRRPGRRPASAYTNPVTSAKESLETSWYYLRLFQAEAKATAKKLEAMTAHLKYLREVSIPQQQGIVDGAQRHYDACKAHYGEETHAAKVSKIKREIRRLERELGKH